MRYTLLLMLLLSLTAVGQPKQNGLADHNLYGRVRSFIELRVAMVEKDGKLTDNNRMSAEVHSYDKKGNETEWIVYRWDTDDELKINTRTTFTYDKQGKLRDRHMYNYEGKTIDSTVSQTDSAGKRITYTTYNAKGTLVQQYVMVYDDKGNMIDGTVFKPYILESRTKILYDSMGNPTERTEYNNHGEAEMRYVMQYNNKGIHTQTDMYLAKRDGTEGHATFRYDPYGNISSHNDVRQQDSTLPTKIEYEYDRHHNWTRSAQKSSIGRSQPFVTVTTRGIQYYKRWWLF